MNQQSPGKTHPRPPRGTIPLLLSLLLVVLVACNLPSFGAQDDTSRPTSDTSDTNDTSESNDQIATFVALTVTALEENSPPRETQPTAPPIPPPARPPTFTPPPPAPTAPVATGSSECGRRTADICDSARVVEVAALAIRAAPDRKATYLGEVPRDISVDALCLDNVQADGRVWACVRFQDIEGWMSTRYLVFGLPPLPAGKVCDYATVVEVEALNIRSEPTRQSPTMGDPVPRGGRVEVLCNDMVEADGRVWARIRIGAIEGWMSTRYLAFDNP